MAVIDHRYHRRLLLSFLATVVSLVHASNVFIKSSLMYPLTCYDQIQTCDSYLYHNSVGLSIEQTASFYSVNTSSIKPVTRGLKQDYLLSVTCTCKDVNGTRAYFYDTLYTVQPGDTFYNTSGVLYCGQAWQVSGQEKLFIAGDTITLHLLCGCTQVTPQVIVTYTVQDNDTLWGIADLLSAKVSDIESVNTMLVHNPSFIKVGWVLFIPKEKKGIQARKQGKKCDLTPILVVVSVVILFSICTLVLFFLRRSRGKENPKALDKVPSPTGTPLGGYLRKKDIKDATFESERPVVYSLEEIDEATRNFEESRKIGEGGYGSVYFGILKDREVAIKKMKSSRSKEFFAELKVLCKIHHINVVELLGYASGERYLYLVYEYVQNGSLSDHLHDPLLKGQPPLSWTARAHIALDAARGIEYIHDHTKARYVHRDIKTSNILLDQGLRAKVADFGLARLVERSNEEDSIATRLVGTPGYIAPESVRGLQMTSTTDVFAFGVVLSELITGHRALMRDGREPNKIKSLISVIWTIFNEQDSVTALKANIDDNLRGSYPFEEVHKMAKLAGRCLSEDPANRPEIREVVPILLQVLMSSMEWEASLGGSSQIFTGIHDGR